MLKDLEESYISGHAHMHTRERDNWRVEGRFESNAFYHFHLKIKKNIKKKKNVQILDTCSAAMSRAPISFGR